MKKLTISAIMLVSLSAQARVKGMEKINGEWGAGGGNALVCFNNEASVTQTKENDGIIPDNVLSDINRIEMYDLYEAKMNRGLSQETPEIVEIKDNEDIYRYIDEMGRRYISRVNYLNIVVEDAVKILPKSRIRYTTFGIDQQNDIANVILPSGRCLITTMAAQINVGDHYKLIIDQRLYNHEKHSYQSKATLILHEVIYAHFRKNFNHQNSAAVREVVSSLITYHEDITESSVAKQLADLKVVDASFGVSTGFTIRPYSAIRDGLKPYVLASNFEWFARLLFGLVEGDLLPLGEKLENSSEFISFFYEILGRAQSEGLQFEEKDPTIKNLNEIFNIVLGQTKDPLSWLKRLDKYEVMAEQIRSEAIAIMDEYPTKVQRIVEEGRYPGRADLVEPDKYPNLFFYAFKEVLKRGTSDSFFSLFRKFYFKSYGEIALERLFSGTWWIEIEDGELLGTMDFYKPVPRRVK